MIRGVRENVAFAFDNGRGLPLGFRFAIKDEASCLFGLFQHRVFKVLLSCESRSCFSR